MTRTPDPQPQPTLEEIAERIMWPAVGKIAPTIWNEMVYDVLEALRNERDRAAKIADERAALNAQLRDKYRPEHPRLANMKDMRKEEAETIASEIRDNEDSRECEELARQAAMEDDAREQEPFRW